MILSAIVCHIQLKAFAFFFLQLGCVNFPYLILQIVILKELSTCLVSLPGAGEGDAQGCFLSLGFAWAEPGLGERESWFHFCLNTWERNIYLSSLEADQY